jgi:glutamate N-acetyltransferase/amino-acid N-acetyltransferase
MLVATGASGIEIVGDRELEDGLGVFFTDLAIALIRDAEGATKFVTVSVDGGENSEECLRVAYAISESTLVKTAMFASDPNWGRILAVIGRSDIEGLDIDAIEIMLGDTMAVLIHPTQKLSVKWKWRKKTWQLKFSSDVERPKKRYLHPIYQ